MIATMQQDLIKAITQAVTEVAGYFRYLQIRIYMSLTMAMRR